MARKRKEKSLPEFVFGIFVMIVAVGVLNPKLRQQMVSTFASILTMGIIGFVIHLAIKAQKTKEDPLTFRNPDLNPVRKPPLSNFQNHSKDAGKFDIGIAPRPILEETKPIPMEWDDIILKIVEWRRFEIITKEFLRMNGFEATETKTGADGGVDITIHKTNNPESKGIVQCKAWNTYKVGIKIVRELFGVMAADRIPMGMVITSGEFTSEAEEFAKGKMTLVSGQKFLELIRKLPDDKQKHLLDVALEGDYQTPTCPQCDIKLTLRESLKGRNAGGHFWGCVNYPRCKQTLVYKET